MSELSDSQRKHITDWISKRCPDFTCPACGKDEFALADHIITPTIHSGGNLILGGPSYPQVMLVCKNCAHTHYFNTVVMKLKIGDSDG